jgi:hypothetical protein
VAARAIAARLLADGVLGAIGAAHALPPPRASAPDRPRVLGAVGLDLYRRAAGRSATLHQPHGPMMSAPHTWARHDVRPLKGFGFRVAWNALAAVTLDCPIIARGKADRLNLWKLRW